jgi:hypothetical protein
MKFYYINADMEGMPYTKTLADAKRLAREVAANSHHDIEVDLVDVATDRETMLRLMNNTGGFQTTIRTVYTAKAGLKGGVK